MRRKATSFTCLGPPDCVRFNLFQLIKRKFSLKLPQQFFARKSAWDVFWQHSQESTSVIGGKAKASAETIFDHS